MGAWTDIKCAEVKLPTVKLEIIIIFSQNLAVLSCAPLAFLCLRF